MTAKPVLKILAIAAAAGMLTLVAGCSEEEAPTEPVVDDHVNAYKPNANGQMLSAVTFGDADKRSHMWHMEPDGAGGYYFRGSLNSNWGVGRLTATGGIDWFTSVIYRPRDIQPISGTSGGLVVIGAHDNDDDGLSEIGYLSFFDANGALLSQTIYSDAATDRWFNGVAATSDSTFLAIGGFREGEVQHPFLATFRLTSSRAVAKGEEAVLQAIDGIGNDVVVDAGSLSKDEIAYYVTTPSGPTSAETRWVSVRALRSPPDLSSIAIDWSHEIRIHSNLGTRTNHGDQLALVDGALYVVGVADSDKEPMPSSGGYWDSAFATSLSTTGSVRWQTSVELSTHSDEFFGMFVGADILYCIGRSAHYVRFGRLFGYGLISKLDKNDGRPIAHLSLGSDSYRSRFSDAIVVNDVAFCGGFTNSEVTGGPYPGWLAEVDVLSQSGDPEAVAKNGRNVVDANRLPPTRGDM